MTATAAHESQRRVRSFTARLGAPQPGSSPRGRNGRKGTPRAFPCGPHTRARSCDARGCGVWDCSIEAPSGDRKSTRLNSSHVAISYAVFCLKKKNKRENVTTLSD